MSLNYELIPFEKICRTCLSQANEFRSLFSIDETAGETLRLFEMLMCCTPVQVNLLNILKFVFIHNFNFQIMLNDGLPSQICMQCVEYINRAYSFRQLCERSENALREILGRPIQQTLLELKPLLTTETLITNHIPEIITSVTESFQNPIPLNEAFALSQNMNSIQNTLRNNIAENVKDSNDINDPTKTQEVTENYINTNFTNLSENSQNSLEDSLKSKISIGPSIITSEETKSNIKDITMLNEISQLETHTEDDSSKCSSLIQIYF